MTLPILRGMMNICLCVVLSSGPLKTACAALLQESDSLMMPPACGLLVVNPGCMRLHRIASKFGSIHLFGDAGCIRPVPVQWRVQVAQTDRLGGPVAPRL